jgi:hypothetical protein
VPACLRRLRDSRMTRMRSDEASSDNEGAGAVSAGTRPAYHIVRQAN